LSIRRCIVMFTWLAASVAFVFALEVPCYWDPDLIVRGPSGVVEATCTRVLAPTLLEVQLPGPSGTTFSTHIVLAGVRMLPSVLRKDPDTVMVFNRSYLENRSVFLSSMELGEGFSSALVWVEDPQQPQKGLILWNMALIVNGFAQIHEQDNILTEYVRICGCQ